MATILVVYGTTEGQTRKIAEHIGTVARRQGHDAEVVDSTGLSAPLVPGACDAVIVGASVHQGKHQTSVAHFVRDNLDVLANVPSAFFSVSLAAASRDEDERAEARALMQRFCDETGWRPDRTQSVAGALLYTRYDFFKRMLMKLIARKEGGPTDTAHDHEFTDWAEVTRFVEEFLRDVVGPRLAASPSGGEP